MEKVKGKAACALCVSSSSGGGGKTLLSLGLARALSRQGFLVKTFKKGPDYIDAAWLALASGRACTNLDPFFLSKEDLQDLFSRSLARLDKNDQPVFALLEGNRGLYDGLDWQGSCSTAELARTLSCPVLLTIDCTKMTRTVAAVVQGLVHFDRTLSFAGLVLNRVGTSRQALLLRKPT